MIFTNGLWARRFGWILGGFVALVLYFWVMYSVLGWIIHSEKEVEVPNLLEKNLEEALDLLKPVQLYLAKEGSEFSEDLPPGTVLRQKPSPGRRVREGKAIRVVLSSGGEVVYVPEIIGLPLPEAESMIRRAGLALGEVTESYSAKYETGKVMIQEPSARSILPKAAFMAIQVSIGPPPQGIMMMPDFVNQHILMAQEWGRKEKVRIELISEDSSSAPAGTILSQTPTPDTMIDGGIGVQFIVARSTAVSENVRFFSYTVSYGKGRVEIKMEVQNASGSVTIAHHSFRNGGEEIIVPLEVLGPVRVRVFEDGTVVHQEMLE